LPHHEFYTELIMCVVVDRVNLSVEAIVKQKSVNVVTVVAMYSHTTIL